MILDFYPSGRQVIRQELSSFPGCVFRGMESLFGEPLAGTFNRSEQTQQRFLHSVLFFVFKFVSSLCIGVTSLVLAVTRGKKSRGEVRFSPRDMKTGRFS